MAEAKKGKANLKRKREELRALSVEELRKQLTEKQEQLMQDRFRHATAALENTSLLKSTRRQIARIETVLREKREGASK